MATNSFNTSLSVLLNLKKNLIHASNCTVLYLHNSKKNILHNAHETTMVVDYDIDAVAALVEEFEVLAFDIFRGGRLSGSELVRDRRIRAWFGCSLDVVAVSWYLLDNNGYGLKEGSTKARFLWALNALKTYPTEANGASRVGGVDEGTWSHWVWYLINALSYLENSVVSFLQFFIFKMPFLS